MRPLLVFAAASSTVPSHPCESIFEEASRELHMHGIDAEPTLASGDDRVFYTFFDGSLYPLSTYPKPTVEVSFRKMQSRRGPTAWRAARSQFGHEDEMKLGFPANARRRAPGWSLDVHTAKRAVDAYPSAVENHVASRKKDTP